MNKVKRRVDTGAPLCLYRSMQNEARLLLLSRL